MLEVFGAGGLSDYLDLPIGLFLASRPVAPRGSSSAVAKGKLYHALSRSGSLFLGEALQITDAAFLRLNQGRSPAVLSHFEQLLANVGLQRHLPIDWSPPSPQAASQIPLAQLLDIPPPPHTWRFKQKDAQRLGRELANRGIETVPELLARYPGLAQAGIKHFEFLPSLFWHHGIRFPRHPAMSLALQLVEPPKSVVG
jgi:hypothetical protein